MTKEKWEEMLHVSGVAEIRAQYWHQYNYEKYKHSSSPVKLHQTDMKLDVMSI